MFNIINNFFLNYIGKKTILLNIWNFFLSISLFQRIFFPKFLLYKFKVKGIYMSPNSLYGYDAENYLKYALILIYIRIIIFIAWIINWIFYFSMKNRLHLILTLTAFVFITSKIIDYFDYKKKYESNQVSKISIIRPYIDKFRDIFITNTFILINCCYCIEKKPKVKVIYKILILWCYYLIFYTLLHRICNIYVYYIIGFIVHIIINNIIIMTSGVYDDDELIIFMTNEAKSFFFMLQKIIVPETKTTNIFDEYELYIISDILIIIFQCILAYCFRMRESTKNDYYELLSTINERNNNNNKNTSILYQQNKIIITKNVTQIYPHNIYSKNINTIDFEEGSKLLLINSYTFQYLPIRYIKIPPSVKEISDFAFFKCKNLQYIEFEEKSHISTFRNILDNSSICKINIPSSVVRIEDSWCLNVKNLNEIFISPLNHNFILLNNEFILGKLNKNSIVFNTIIFARRDIRKIIIPSYIKRINPNAFKNCNKICYVKFAKDSKLILISENAFSESSIKEMIIPKNVSIINASAFSKCKKLITIDFEKNSNLMKICDNAFSESSLEKINIPNSIVGIGKNAFSNCSKLKWINISDDSNLTIIEENAFNHSSIVSFTVTSKVNLIGNQAFANCKNLQIIEFHKNSLFDENMFKNSSNVIIMISVNNY